MHSDTHFGLFDDELATVQMDEYLDKKQICQCT